MKNTHSGFIAIIGPTNAGKSTLINQIMERKVSIVSHKVQTTRTRIRAVKMVDADTGASHPSCPPHATQPVARGPRWGGAARDFTGLGGGYDSGNKDSPPSSPSHPTKSAISSGPGAATLPPKRGETRAHSDTPPVQLIFVDTPGVFKPARRLDRAMVAAATDAVTDADAVLLIVDAMHGVTPTIRHIAELLQKSNAGGQKPIFAVINKTDAVKKADLLPIAAELSQLAPFGEIFMLSALKDELGKNGPLDKMLRALADVMPESPYLFDPHDYADVPDELYLAELTREKIYKFVHQELPYHIHVVTEKTETDPEGVLEIYQKILVASENHKKIVVGSGGAQLKQIGTAARHDIQDQWGVNARLHLFVRVEPDWEDRRENYEEQGLEFKK
ncbi:MAG: GTPase Era [Proteobacteria bacterium]|nr:GTPase Era [Pseudomonadota bacterium]